MNIRMPSTSASILKEFISRKEIAEPSFCMDADVGSAVGLPAQHRLAN